MAPVPTVKMRVLRSFYLKRDDLKVKGTDVDVPRHIAMTLLSDGKAEFVREKPKKEEAPAAEKPAPAAKAKEK